MSKEYEIKEFKSQQVFRSWLDKNHSKVDGIWLRLYKKGSGLKSLTYSEAVDEALCYGWIDGQAKKHDEESWIQKFTPRRKKSIWSKINVEKADRLIREGKMHQAGHDQIESARKDGRLQAAYDSHKSMKIPEDFVREISKNKKAKAFFDTLNKTNLYSIAWRLQTAVRPETLKKRKKAILQMLREGKKFHG